MSDKPAISLLDLDEVLKFDPELLLPLFKKPVSGTYRNATPAEGGSILELRVDVDGRRPQDRLSGDLYIRFAFCGIPITLFTGSFVVEDLDIDSDPNEMSISGPVVYYANPSNTADSIRVHIPRVSFFATPAPACVEWLTNGAIVRTYACPKTSAYFRTVTLEIDRFQGTVFPPSLDPDLEPAAPNLPSSVSVRQVYQAAGIDLTVVQDDLLNDPDSPDPGNNWSEVELHDLMEDHFDSFANTLQWNLYGAVVPRFGDPGYNSGYYGTMFDWGGWQTGDTYFRQGLAIAEDAIRGREVDGLYDTSDEKDRLILQTFVHEVGHAFNLPHSWSRTDNPDSGSESFMNYPWGYTDNGGGESNFWANFRWEFDDVELVWMRHADRNDVIFGGRDWIGNNLSIYLRPEMEMGPSPLTLEVEGQDVYDLGVPVELQLKLANTSGQPIDIVERLEPEAGLLEVYIERPSGEIVRFAPPIRRLMAPPETVTLAPGEAHYASISLSFGSKGYQFAEPGEYLIRFILHCFPIGFLATASYRLRIAHPRGRGSEELVHLLTDRRAAQFIYYGGTARHSTIVDRLREAAERYAATDPVAVRHIQTALGRNALRNIKRVEVKDGKRLVAGRKADPLAAVEHLAAACQPLPDGEAPAFNDLVAARLAGWLADGYLQLGRRADANRVLRQTLDGLEQRGAPEAAMEECRRRLDAPRRRSRR